METVDTKQKTKKDYFSRFYAAFLSLSIGYSFAFIVIKALKLGFTDYSWSYFWVPLLAYVLASLSYIIITFGLAKMKRKESKKSFREEKYIKRSLENWKIETETGKQFKRILILLATIILAYFLIGCSKKAQEKTLIPGPYIQPCFDINLAKGVIWHPIYSGYDYPGFDTLGNYYENGSIKAKYTWDGCSIVSVSSPTNSAYNFSFGISKLTPDSLQVETARFGVKNFYK
jgi:hypothetical protein